MKHQLNIHLDDFGPHLPTRRVEVRYSYPHAGRHSLREQVLVLESSNISPRLRTDLDMLYGALTARIPSPESVRLPHAELTPIIEPAILTFVVLDQFRAAELPIARLYFYESIPALRSRFEDQVRVTREEWVAEERVLCRRIATSVRKIAWKAYEDLMQKQLFPE